MLVDLLDQLRRPRLDLVGERLDEVGAGERVDGVGGAGLVGDDLLGAQRDARGALGRAGRAPRRSRWCAATACRRRPRRSAWSATRTMLFSGCWAMSVTPPVCVWKRSFIERSSWAPKRSRMICAHMRRAARNFATSWKTLLWPLKKNARRGREVVDREAGVDRRLHVGDAVGEREGDLLDGRGALLAEVVAGDRDRVPARDVLAGSRRRGRSSGASTARAGR